MRDERHKRDKRDKGETKMPAITRTMTELEKLNCAINTAEESRRVTGKTFLAVIREDDLLIIEGCYVLDNDNIIYHTA